MKKTLSEFANPETGKISADTLLAEIIKPEDELGWYHASQRLARKFRNHGLKLLVDDLSTAETVRDLAQHITRKLTK